MIARRLPESCTSFWPRWKSRESREGVSVGDAKPAQQRDVARVGTDGCEPRIHVELADGRWAPFLHALEPVEGGIALAKRGEHGATEVRVLPAGGVGVGVCRKRAFRLAHGDVHRREIPEEAGMTRREGERSA